MLSLEKWLFLPNPLFFSHAPVFTDFPRLEAPQVDDRKKEYNSIQKNWITKSRQAVMISSKLSY